MAVIETWLRQDLKGLVSVRSLQGQVFSLDNGGNLIGVKVTKDGQPVTLTGTVTGYCVLSDGQTVTVTGSGSSGIQNGNEAYIVLPQLVYSVPGQISIVIKLTSGSTTTTLAACTGYVYKSRTTNEVVPSGTPIPDLATLEEVIRRATAATDAANAATVGAEKVDASMTKEGDIITISVTDRDGNVTEKTITDTADDVTSLKSAFAQFDANVITESADPSPIVSIADGADGMPMRKVEVAIEPVQDLHGYDSPWPAGGGANVLPPLETETKNGVSITVADDGTVTINGTASADTYFEREFAASWTVGTAVHIMAFNPTASSNNRLTIFVLTSSGNPQVNVGDVNSVFSYVAQTEVNATKYRLRVPSGETYTNFVLKPMLQIGGTAPTSYAPYSNICPISGWTGAKVTRTGKNLLPNAMAQDTSTRVRLGESTVGDGIRLKAGTYRISYAYKDGTVPLTPYWRTVKDGVAGSINNAWVIAIDEDINVRIWLYNSQGVSVDNVEWAMVELGSTASEYEPYRGQTYEVTFPTEAGTVYGGTLTVNEDGTGSLKINRAMVVIDGVNKTVRENGTTSTTSNAWFSGAVNKVYGRNNFISDRFLIGFQDPGSMSGRDNSVGIEFRLPADIQNTSDALNQWFTDNPTQLCYELATPQTYTLTAPQVRTLLGTNNVWADAGDVSVEYRADTKLYIEQLTKPTEDDMTANTAITSGKFFMIGNRLFLATMAIASGAMIIPGTNCTELSLADALNNINA